MTNKVQYIKGWNNLPPHGEDKMLFVSDENMPSGYRIETGHYYEYVCGASEPCFFHCGDKGLFSCNHIEGVFAWIDMPTKIVVPTKNKASK